MAIGLDLDQYQLKRRVLLVFAPSPRDTRYEEQKTYLQDDSGKVDAWKLVPFGIFEEGPSFAEERPISVEDSGRAREEFGVRSGDFAVRLIDLNGSEVLRSAEPLPADVLIDACSETP